MLAIPWISVPQITELRTLSDWDSDPNYFEAGFLGTNLKNNGSQFQMTNDFRLNQFYIELP